MFCCLKIFFLKELPQIAEQKKRKTDQVTGSRRNNCQGNDNNAEYAFCHKHAKAT